MTPAIFPETYGYYAGITIAFAAIGAGLKYIDDAFDDEWFSKRKAMLIAPLLVIIWVGLSIYDSLSATILFSILFAVLLTGKVDNLAFKISSIALILVFFLTRGIHFLMVPLFVLILTGIADEEGSDYVEKIKYNKIPKLGAFFFLHRCCMKLGMLGLCTVSLLAWPYLVAFLAFDMAYDFVGLYGYSNISTICSSGEPQIETPPLSSHHDT